MTRQERLRAQIESRIINMCKSRKLKNAIMNDIDQLVYLMVADRMGLTEADIVDACNVADECGLP